MMKTTNYQLRTTGFTVLELLIVIVIMGMVIAMSIPAFSGYLRGARLRGGAQEVASALRMARQLAITNRADYSVDFHSGNRQFWVERNNLTPGTVNTLVDKIRILPDTIVFHSFLPAPPPPPSYNFSARGTTGSGSIRIVDPNNNGMEIVIVGATGRVRIEHWSP